MKVVQSWTIRKFQNFGSHQKVMDDLLQHRQYRKFEPLNLSKNIRLVRKPRSLNLTEQNPLCWVIRMGTEMPKFERISVCVCPHSNESTVCG